MVPERGRGQVIDRFDFTVTEVAARNVRSLKAHARVGFQTLHVYADPTTREEWHVLALDFGGYARPGNQADLLPRIRG